MVAASSRTRSQFFRTCVGGGARWVADLLTQIGLQEVVTIDDESAQFNSCFID